MFLYNEENVFLLVLSLNKRIFSLNAEKVRFRMLIIFYFLFIMLNDL